MQCAEIFDFVLVLPMKIGQKIIPYTTLVKLKNFSALSWLPNLHKKVQDSIDFYSALDI